PVTALHRLVVLEAQLRRRVKLDALGELRPEEATRALQAFRGLGYVLRVERGVEHLGVRDVGRDVDAGDCDHADPRVAQLALQEVGQFPLDQVAQLLRATRIPASGAFQRVRATS